VSFEYITDREVNEAHRFDLAELRAERDRLRRALEEIAAYRAVGQGEVDARVLKRRARLALADPEAPPRPAEKPTLPALTFEEATAMVVGAEQQVREWTEAERAEQLTPPRPHEEATGADRR
jgi:hypothetical protein